MPFASWWRGDSLPDLSPLPSFSVHRSTDIQLLADLTHLPQQTIDARFQSGNDPYVAFIDEVPAAYGWVARRKGGISAFQFFFSVPAGDIYLWDFLTLPQWRGRGLYPYLLQSIFQQEPSIDRFWIGYEPGNEASARGMSKAGFHVAGDFVIVDNHVIGVTLFDASKYALLSPAVFDLPIVPEPHDAL